MAQRVMIAMSGGVDSSVAAYLMKERGFDCAGATMKLLRSEDSDVDADAKDARGAASHLKIPHYVFDFTEDFDQGVIRSFVEAYERGCTPNPCVDCNRCIKFGIFFSRMEELEYSLLATGHYARVQRTSDGTFLLKKALDSTKDQSYFLYTMTQDRLARTLFPLGEMLKTEVREIAAVQGFSNAQKRESQDVCFVPEGSYADFIQKYTGKNYEPGDFIDGSGNVLGRHEGLIRYTLGQRRGLKVSSASGRMYVCDKNLERNTITLGDEKMLYSRELHVENLNWISGIPPKDGQNLKLEVKTGYRRPGRQAALEILEACGTGGGRARVLFDEPQCSAAAGQAAVFYDGDTVVGGGTVAAPRQGEKRDTKAVKWGGFTNE